jgi:hypothetical protein
MHRDRGAKHLANVPRQGNFAAALALAAGLATTAVLPAHADAVIDWNDTAETTAIMYAGPPPFQMRIMAMVQVAVHDALNAVQPRYAAYTEQPPANAGASAGA